MANPDLQILSLNSITRDETVQQRAGGIKSARVSEYARNMRNGDEFPPVVVFYDGEQHWLADGFHRCFAVEANEESDIEAAIHEGGKREALLYAAGANAEHGVRRTNADKRKAVMTLLTDPDWSQWTDHAISKQTHTTQPFVSKLRKEMAEGSDDRKKRPSSRGVTQQLSRTWKIADKRQRKQWVFQHQDEIREILEIGSH